VEASHIQRLSAPYPISIYLENHQFYLINWKASGSSFEATRVKSCQGVLSRLRRFMVQRA
jgi:hypothetical protein